MKSVDVTAGTLEYREEGDASGPPVVLLHGLLMNDAQWNLALPLLPPGYRYLLPVLPMGGHRIPMREDADLTLPAMAGLVADFLDALDLTDTTLVVSDWGGALLLTDIGRDKRVARLVICPSEAYDNFPPGFPGKVAWLASRNTATVWLAMRQLKIGWLRRQWLMFGQMSKMPVPQDIVDEWLAAGLADRRIRRDLVKYCRSKFDGKDLIRATNRLAEFDGQALVLWSRNPVMPADHGERLAALLPPRSAAADRRCLCVDHDGPTGAHGSSDRRVPHALTTPSCFIWASTSTTPHVSTTRPSAKRKMKISSYTMGLPLGGTPT